MKKTGSQRSGIFKIQMPHPSCPFVTVQYFPGCW